MPLTLCAHCKVSIIDPATMIDHNGKTFCCTNCAAAASGRVPAGVTIGTCAHCQVEIADPSTKVERAGLTFCCPSCAAAMPTGARR